MKFIDEAKVFVKAGDGGRGCVSFRREKFVPKGGPDGGNGGKGGDILFVADGRLSSLLDFKYKREYEAGRGGHGEGSLCSGKNGRDLRIKVPVGTVIKELDTGDVLSDLVKDGQSYLCCKGGRGGKGNAHFKTATFQTPRFAQPGETGEERSLKLELKLLADVGIIGFPNAGKSTLISHISAARPKIAAARISRGTPNSTGARSFVRRTTTSSGTRTMRATVRELGRFIGQTPPEHCIAPPVDWRAGQAVRYDARLT